MRVLLRIRIDHLLYDHKPAPSDTVAFDDYLAQMKIDDPAWFQIIKVGGEAAQAVEEVRAGFRQLAAGTDPLPFPAYFNVDRTFGVLSYGLTRHLKPDFVLETGVGYGITSALVLLAMERNNRGHLASIDLPPLSDPTGSWTGRMVPDRLRPRWSLRLGSSRHHLGKVLSSVDTVGLFISDSANVYSLQRYELDTLSPKLAMGGAALVNNVGSTFQAFLRSTGRAQCHCIWQVDKPASATGVIVKR